MKRNLMLCALVAALILLLTGCGCDHVWYDATCVMPQTCWLCGKAEGELQPHTWQDATCIAPKTCAVCQKTEGKLGTHKWQAATTEAPKTCTVCNATVGSKLDTDPRFITERTEALQGAWVCDVVVTGDRIGLENFGDVACTLTLEFGNTGRLTQRIKVKDEESFVEKLKQYAVERTYATFAEAGLNAEQANQATIETYGMNINDLVEDTYKDYDFNELFASFNIDKVYYVEGSKVFKAPDWNAKFESGEFKITGDKLVIQGVSLEEGGPALEWKKA